MAQITINSTTLSWYEKTYLEAVDDEVYETYKKHFCTNIVLFSIINVAGVAIAFWGLSEIHQADYKHFIANCDDFPLTDSHGITTHCTVKEHDNLMMLDFVIHFLVYLSFAPAYLTVFLMVLF